MKGEIGASSQNASKIDSETKIISTQRQGEDKKEEIKVRTDAKVYENQKAAEDVFYLLPNLEVSELINAFAVIYASTDHKPHVWFSRQLVQRRLDSTRLSPVNSNRDLLHLEPSCLICPRTSNVAGFIWITTLTLKALDLNPFTLEAFLGNTCCWKPDMV
ncbi:Flotillin-like [Forsythia ovata]|uniref:Flotillin-like n=1 Tax=Forsythia ovata TaxID=205694 RepID=A0ABD1WGT8_9LAMI